MAAKTVCVIPPLPSTERGRFCSISCDKPGERLLYCSGTNVIWRPIQAMAEGKGDEKPDDVFCWKGHTKNTTCASMSPNGQWVVSGDISGAIRLWGAKGEHIQKNEYKLWDGTVKDVAWSDDSGRILAGGDGKEVRAVALIWDTGSKTGEVGGHTKQVNSIAFRSQRPFRIVTGSEDMAVNFHQGPPFKFVRSHNHHSNFVNGVRYSPDGAWFVSVGSDSKVCLYEGKDGELVKEFEKPAGITGSLWAVAWSPDSARFTTVGGDKKVRIWDREGGLQISEVAAGVAQPDMQVGVAWPTQERIVTICLNGRIMLWDVAADGALKLANVVNGTQGPLHCLACDKKTGTFAYGGAEGVLGISGSTSSTKTATIGKGIQHILTHSENYSGEPEAWVISLDDIVRRFSLDSAEIRGSPVEVKEFVVGADWLDAGETKIVVATGKSNFHCISESSSVEWSKAGAVPRRPTALATCAGRLAVGLEKPEGMTGGVVSSQYDIMLFDVNDTSAEGIVEKAVLQKHAGEVCALRFSPSGEFLASSDALNKIFVWDFKGEAPVVKISDFVFHTARVTCLDWLPGGRKLVSGSLDRHLYVWDVDAPGTKVRIQEAHKGGATAVATCANGAFASVGFDGFLLVHELG